MRLRLRPRALEGSITLTFDLDDLSFESNHNSNPKPSIKMERGLLLGGSSGGLWAVIAQLFRGKVTIRTALVHGSILFHQIASNRRSG